MRKNKGRFYRGKRRKKWNKGYTRYSRIMMRKQESSRNKHKLWNQKLLNLSLYKEIDSNGKKKEPKLYNYYKNKKKKSEG